MPLLAVLAIAVSVTAYVPANDVGAMMLPVLPGVTCAVSRDLAHLKGKWIHVRGHGVRFVNDVTHKRLKRRVDLCVADLTEAKKIALGQSEVTAVSAAAQVKKVTDRSKK